MNPPGLTFGAKPETPGLIGSLLLLSLGVFDEADLSRACRICGCTELAACPGGCAWAEHDLCTACKPSKKTQVTCLFP